MAIVAESDGRRSRRPAAAAAAARPGVWGALGGMKRKRGWWPFKLVIGPCVATVTSGPVSIQLRANCADPRRGHSVRRRGACAFKVSSSEVTITRSTEDSMRGSKLVQFLVHHAPSKLVPDGVYLLGPG
jgi:hypothetical protein